MFVIILTKQFWIYVYFFGICVAIINQQFLSRSNILFCYIVESSFALCNQHVFFSPIASTIYEAKPGRYVDVICINIMSYKSSAPSLKIIKCNFKILIVINHLQYYSLIWEFSLGVQGFLENFMIRYIYMSHFAYACKMRCPLNLVLENSKYLWFY